MKRKIKFFHYTPRIIGILAILFVSMFALDAFNEAYTLKEQILGFAMHLIPSYILLVMLIIAWKWERIGGIIFIIIGLITSPFVFLRNYDMNHSFWMSLSVILMITFPFILAGLLFIISHYLKKQEGIKSPQN
jgi:hypothetical protein